MKRGEHMYIYPAIFEKEDKFVNVSFPDLPGCFTFGESMEEALRMAQDVLEGYLLVLEDDKDDIPAARNPFEIKVTTNQLVVPIEADTKLVREKEEAKLIKKTLTIPSYLNTLANDLGINFSATLTEALKEKIGV